MHLACGVFRAVEMRTPLLIAANGGLSAHIDHLGRIVELSERQEPQFLLADVPLPEPSTAVVSLYARWGDWFAALCMVCCVVLAGVGMLSKAPSP